MQKFAMNKNYNLIWFPVECYFSQFTTLTKQSIDNMRFRSVLHVLKVFYSSLISLLEVHLDFAMIINLLILVCASFINLNACCFREGCSWNYGAFDLMRCCVIIHSKAWTVWSFKRYMVLRYRRKYQSMMKTKVTGKCVFYWN